MKGIHIFCSSQAATAICSAMDGASSSSALSSPSSSSTLLLGGGDGGRAIDRHNPIIRDSKRYVSISVPPCVGSQPPPISPKPHRVTVHKKLKNEKKRLPLKQNDDRAKVKTENISDAQNTSAVRRTWSCTKQTGEFISPGNSTRYLLGGDKALLHSFSEFEQRFPSGKAKEAVENADGSREKKPDSSAASAHQVVVLRVSLHCRGCERKMRKHISSMQGVTSFDIDFAAKKVTVTGNITPLEVLSSISKVKNAQLWPPALQASNVPTDSNSEFKNEYKGAVFT